MAALRQPSATASNPDLAIALTNYLASKDLRPKQDWMQSFIPTVRSSTPIIALQKTALFRLLAADITTSVQSSPSTTFLPGIADPAIKDQRLPGPIAVQVLDVEDIGRSRWSQVEALEAQERGETTKGREVVRVLPEEGTAGPNAPQAAGGQSKSAGPHKLLLQDAKGTKAYALELRNVQGIDVGMAIGTKLVLKDVSVARGVIMLEPRCVEVLGGKVDAWDRKWREERKKVLKEKAGIQG
jgi:RecQ-mediated genome instability protein 1